MLHHDGTSGGRSHEASTGGGRIALAHRQRPATQCDLEKQAESAWWGSTVTRL